MKEHFEMIFSKTVREKEVFGLESSSRQMDALIKKAIHGNTEAYGQLIEYYKEYLYKTAFLLVNNQEQALDIVGETILRGFRFIHKVKQPNYFKTWLTKVLVNIAKDYYRKYPEMEDIDAVTVQAAIISEREISIEEKIDINRAISLLSDKYRMVIVLKYFDELTIHEISLAMGIPEGSVKAYLHRAKAELRKLCQ